MPKSYMIEPDDGSRLRVFCDDRAYLSGSQTAAGFPFKNDRAQPKAVVEV